MKASSPKQIVFVALLLCIMLGCGESKPTASVVKRDLAEARKEHTTQLLSRGPAPQSFRPITPPPGVEAVEYPSGDLKLKGWITKDPGDGRKHPAVVFLHGGWAFAREDWNDASDFAKADFVVFTPMLRGENGNPGIYSTFYHEVDDAIAAGRYVASLPNVDSENIFIAGHSVGAVLTTLVAMMPSPYKSAAALSGYLDMERWVTQEDAERVVFDRHNPKEIELRNPMAFVHSLRIPVSLYVEPRMERVNRPFLDLATTFGKSCELQIVPGNHMTMVKPAVQRAIQQFRRQMNP